MTEGTHSSVAVKNTGGKRKLLLVMAGTAAAVLIGGVLFQIFRGEPTVAAVESGQSQDRSGAGSARVGGPQAKQQYVARVNDESLTWDALARECVARHGKDVLNSMIDRMIVQQACEERGVVISRGEVEAEIHTIAERFNMDTGNWFAMLEAERKITPFQYRRDIIWPMLALKTLAGAEITVTKQEMHEGFIRNYGEKVKARMMMFDNMRRAQDVWEQVMKNPGEFAVLAKKHSVEPNSRALEGKIPPIRQYGGNESLEEAAFKLREGEISGIVQVGTKFVVLLCEGRTVPVVTQKDGFTDEMQKTLREQLLEEKIQAAVANTFSRIKDEATIHNFMNGVTTNGKIRQTSGTKRPAVRTAAGQGQPRRQKTSTGRAPISSQNTKRR